MKPGQRYLKLLAQVLAGCCALLVIDLPARGQPQREQEEPRKKPYELRLIEHGDTSYGVRWKPDTGEAWVMEGGTWTKVEEKAPLPPGDYEVFLTKVKEHPIAIRFDHKTGTGWQMDDRKWLMMVEPNKETRK